MMPLGFSFVFPFFLIMVLLQGGAGLFGRDLRGWRLTLIFVLSSVFIAVTPVGGLPLARWMISFNANFSISLTAILFCRVLESSFGVKLLDKKALLTCWGFSLTAGVILYPMALGLGRFDPYQAGWGFSWLFVVVCGVTILLLIMKNRFAVVLMAVILAHNLHLLESTNLWDYLVDPFMVLVSCIALGSRFSRKLSDRP
jgi:hypothetical protein